MCNYPNHVLITLRRIETGQLMYTFEHWDTDEHDYCVVHRYPSNQTQVLFYLAKDQFEVVDRKEWSM